MTKPKIIRAVARNSTGEVTQIFEWEVSKHSQSHYTKRRVKKWAFHPWLGETITFDERRGW